MYGPGVMQAAMHLANSSSGLPGMPDPHNPPQNAAQVGPQTSLSNHNLSGQGQPGGGGGRPAQKPVGNPHGNPHADTTKMFTNPSMPQSATTSINGDMSKGRLFLDHQKFEGENIPVLFFAHKKFRKVC